MRSIRGITNKRALLIFDVPKNDIWEGFRYLISFSANRAPRKTPAPSVRTDANTEAQAGNPDISDFRSKTSNLKRFERMTAPEKNSRIRITGLFFKIFPFSFYGIIEP